MYKVILIIIGLSVFSHVSSQNLEKYISSINHADSLYKLKEYHNAAITYEKAFETLGAEPDYNHLYRAASSFSLAEKKDKAFYYLRRFSNKNTKNSNFERMLEDIDLISLHRDRRWRKLVVIAKEYKTKKAKLIPVVKELESIYVEDQKHRKFIFEKAQELGRSSKEFRKIEESMNTIDANNLVKVERILESHGWLGTNLIGTSANMALFLVIQHADLDTQLKYLSLMRDATIVGNIAPNQLALLEDRIALRQGKKQIYGSQILINQKSGIYYVHPIRDPEKVDQRRKKVRLRPMSEYVKNWGLIWDVELQKLRKESLKTKN